MSSQHVLIIGAGPVGLEAAVLAHGAGFRVTVIESGTTVGAGIVDHWHHVPMFTPWAMNTTAGGLRAIDTVGSARPIPSETPTGLQYVESYLEPLADYLDTRVDLRLGTDAVAVGRGALLKPEEVASPARAATPFRVLVDSDESEDVLEADVVLDCSGVTDFPGFLGVGGIPALGEADLDHRILRRIPDALGEDRAEFENQRVLVVGSGYSAATTLQALVELKRKAPRTSIVWATRETAPPTRIPADPLPARARLAAFARAMMGGDARVTWIPGVSVRALSLDGERVEVELERVMGGRVTEVVDQVVANVGYRPSSALFEELQVDMCSASQAPMKLGAALLAASGGPDGDGLAAPGSAIEILMNREPGFFVLGAKSYGRNSTFLLGAGFEQVARVIEHLRATR